MKYIEKISLLLLSFVLIGLCLFASPTKASAATEGYYIYTVSNNEATITGVYTSVSGDITIPSTLGGYPVTSIGSGAFEYCPDLTSVTIPDSVTTIGNLAFNECYALTGIWVSDNNSFYSSDEYGVLYSKDKTVLMRAPSGISGDYIILDSVNSIDRGAFYFCGLTRVTIPDSVTSIGEWAFAECRLLTSVTIPNNVTSIAQGALSGCTSLTSVAIHDSVASIGDYAFQRCESLTSVTIPDSVTSIGDYAFSNCDSLTSVTIPDGVTSIGEWAFRECRLLTSVTIPESVTSIGQGAFGYCTRLTDVTYCGTESQWNQISIGSNNDYLISATRSYHSWTAGSCTTPMTCAICGDTEGEALGHNLLAGKCTRCGIAGGTCGTNMKWTLDDEGTLTIFGKYYMSDYSYSTTAPWNKLRESIRNVVIEDGVYTIGDYAFYLCSNLTSVTIADSVYSIGHNAFEGCGTLSSITLPKSLRSILSNAFYNCKGLTSISLPDGVTAIWEYAFASCDSLTSVSIPASVTSIDSSAFRYCSNLEGIWVSEANTKYSSDADGVLYNKEKTYLIKAPASILSCIIPQGCTQIASYAFYGCHGLKDVSIPDSIITMGDYAFYGCDSLMTISIPNGLKKLSHYVFGDCSSLAYVTIPYSITSIGSYAFSGCISLSSVGIPDSVTGIGQGAFQGCDTLKTVVIPASVSKLQWGAFSSCDNLVEVTILGKITIIENYCFQNCTRLTSIAIPNDVTSIYMGAFDCCSSLENVIYCGTEEQWNAISIATNNSAITSAIRMYHNWKAIDCTVPKVCTICNTTDEEPLGHDWIEATCITAQICSRCGTESGEPLGHSGGIWMNLRAPTCTTPGIKARICDICKNTEIVELEALGHSNNSVVTAPTCTQQGYTTNTCQLCGFVTISDYVDATGHSFGQWTQVVAPDCTQEGMNARLCACGETETQPIAPLGHTCNVLVTAPTCTEQGYTTKTCTVCGDVWVTDYIEAKGHGWSIWIQITAPSCTAEGSQLRFCNCGSRETQAVEKLPHTFENGLCIVCGTLDSYDWVLSADANINVCLTQNLYIDLDGYDLSGTIITNGYKVYGMDSATNGYSCENMGYFSCVDENGDAIIPESMYTTEDMMRYMTIETENGFTFHRFYMGITNVNLAPTLTGFGYKAEFYGDEMVQSQIASIGFDLWLTEDHVISRTTGFKNSLTLRLKNFDVANYGETPVNACVTITLADGTVIRSATHSETMRNMLETINDTYESYSYAQLKAIKSMIQACPVMKTWNVENLYNPDDTIIDIPIVSNPDGNP